MNVQTNISAAELDEANYYSVRDTSYQDLLVYAARNSGRSVLQIHREFRRMAKSHSRLNMVEYIRHGLFRHDDFTDEQRAAYISNDLHWPMTHICNNRGWATVAEDKVLASTLLSAGGVPVPDALAVIDTSPRSYPGLVKISTPDQLRDMVVANIEGGLFGKIVDGMVSFGAFRVESADATHLICSGHAPMTYDTFMTNFVGGNAYVLQRNLANHPEIARYASALATVRMVNMVTDNGVYCPLAVIKLPQGDNIADAFWRPGNLACEVDVATGKILNIAERAAPEVTLHEDHPAAPGLNALTLPHWDKLVEINAEAARVFAPIRYQSTDIAITPDGPVIVELNYGGGFDLPQYVSRRGMLTPQVRDFFQSHGWSFSAPAKRRLPFFGRK
ncbi:sugar-transfer associated ATP-grasp domain-containing protein [uncultured Roseovarius sp.]|uniref:sugar-transfer associated ATP-grasp domain-containing protein n=1 Tax=Roseovarius sp. TaxID=1486281 RepID=UPI0025F6A54E|nr:sugar-transfer associated ATP-grasp domain-containing protein [uncultured Roseovarius sp.]